MDYTYKEVDGWEWGGFGGWGGWAARGRLQLPTGLFGCSISPRKAGDRLRQT